MKTAGEDQNRYGRRAGGHVRYNSTQTKATSLSNTLVTVGSKLNQLEKSVKEYFTDKILSNYDYEY